MNEIKKIVLFFNMPRGIEVYKKLKDKYNIKIVVTKKNLDNQVYSFLKNKKISHLLVKNLKDKKINKYIENSELGIICGFPFILNETLLKKTKYGFINCHAGRIPHYRGGSPLHWQLINGEKFFYITILKVDSGVDTGPILCQKKFLVKKKYKILDLQKITNKNFPDMVIKAINILKIKKKLLKQKQSNAQTWPQRYSCNSYISFAEKTANEIDRFVKACTKPYEAYAYIKGVKYKILKVKVVKKKYPIGLITKKNRVEYIGCKRNSLVIKKLKI